MNYAIAVICPPLAFLACRRPARAVAAAILMVAALLMIRSGFGLVIQLAAILWAVHAVGDEGARRESSEFVAGVRRIPTFRR